MTLLIGIIVGLAYGWLLMPPTKKGIGLNDLRLDYKTDYVLMVAELYDVERDTAASISRLALLGIEEPHNLVGIALDYANDIGYSSIDLALMQELANALPSGAPER